MNGSLQTSNWLFPEPLQLTADNGTKIVVQPWAERPQATQQGVSERQKQFFRLYKTSEGELSEHELLLRLAGGHDRIRRVIDDLMAMIDQSDRGMVDYAHSHEALRGLGHGEWAIFVARLWMQQMRGLELTWNYATRRWCLRRGPTYEHFRPKRIVVPLDPERWNSLAEVVALSLILA